MTDAQRNPFDRFTDVARRSIAMASRLAAHDRCEIGPLSIAMAVCRESDLVGNGLVASAIDWPPRPKDVAADDLPRISLAAKRAIERAIEFADLARSDVISALHLLRGTLAVDDPAVATFAASIGLDLVRLDALTGPPA
jgi:hypothetical protein